MLEKNVRSIQFKLVIDKWVVETLLCSSERSVKSIQHKEQPILKSSKAHQSKPKSNEPPHSIKKYFPKTNIKTTPSQTSIQSSPNQWSIRRSILNDEYIRIKS
jgi:hypothetical protein